MIEAALVGLSFLFLAVSFVALLAMVGVLDRKLFRLLCAGYVLVVVVVEQFGIGTFALAFAAVNVVAGCGLAYAALEATK